MSVDWLFNERTPALEMKFYEKIYSRLGGRTHGYLGDPDSIRVYRERYLPKMEAMYHRIQMVVKDVQKKDRSNPKLWECVECTPFEEDSFHVGMFIPVCINMQDPPDNLIRDYEKKFGDDAYRKLSEEVNAFIWPQIQRCCRPYIEETKTIHEGARLEIEKDGPDDVYYVTLFFRPSLIKLDKKGRYEFMPGLENWLFTEPKPTPAVEKMNIGQMMARRASRSKLGSAIGKLQYDSDYAKTINAETKRIMEEKKPKEIFQECMAIASKKQGALKGPEGKEFAQGAYARFSKEHKAELCETGGMYWVYVEFESDDGSPSPTAYQPLVSRQSKRWTLHKAAREIALAAMSHKDFKKQQKANESWLFDGFEPSLTPAQEQAVSFIFPTPAEEGIFSRFFKKTEKEANRTPEREEIDPNSMKGRAIYASKNGIFRMENGKFNPMMLEYLRWVGESGELWVWEERASRVDIKYVVLDKKKLDVEEVTNENGTKVRKFKMFGIEFGATLASAEDHDTILDLQFCGHYRAGTPGTTIRVQMNSIAYGWAAYADGVKVWPNDRREAYRLSLRLLAEQFKKFSLPYKLEVSEEDEDTLVSEGSTCLIINDLYHLGDYRDDEVAEKMNEMSDRIEKATDAACKKLQQNSKFRDCIIESDWDKCEFIISLDVR